MVTQLEDSDRLDVDEEEQRALEERLRAAGARIATGSFDKPWTPVKKRSRLRAFFTRLLSARA